MTKNLLIIAAALVTFGANAQQRAGRTPVHQATLPSPAQLQSAKTLTGQTCDSMVTMDLQTATITVYGAGTDSTVPSCTAIAGYIYGTNCYNDKEKANYYNGATYYGSVSNCSVSAVKVFFWHDVAAGEGTQGSATSSIGVCFYAGNNTSGPSGVPFGTKMVSMPTILASSTGNFFEYKYNLTTPVVVPSAGFFTSIIIPDGTTPGDTAVILAQLQPTAGIAWEKFDNNSWHATTETPASWNLMGNMVIIPKYCFDITTSVSKNLGISENVDVYPNPSAGVFKVQTSFIDPKEITINVTNSLGQVILTDKRLTNVELIDLDMSDKPNGVYFVTVSTSTDKMVSKIILNK